MNQSISELKKYITPFNWRAIIAAVLFLGIGLCILITGGDQRMIALFPIIFGGAWLLKWCIEYSKGKKCIDKLISDGSIEDVLSDFKSGTHYFKDTLIVGQDYLIGRKSGIALHYSEITRLYQYIHKTNFVEDKRTLQAEDMDNKTYDIARLELRGTSDEELEKLLEEVLSHNPTIKIGGY